MRYRNTKHRNTVKEVRDIVVAENLRIRQCSDDGYSWHCSESPELVAFYNEESKGVDIEYLPSNTPNSKAKIVIQARDNSLSRNLESKITETLEMAGMYDVVSKKPDPARYHNLLCLQRK